MLVILTIVFGLGIISILYVLGIIGDIRRYFSIKEETKMAKSKREINRDEYIKEIKKNGYKEVKGTRDRFDLKIYNDFENIKVVEDFIKAFISKRRATKKATEEILEAVSEILLNTIIHGYKKPDEIIHIEGSLEHIEKAYGKYCYYLILIISDTGKGITDTNVVLEDKFTTRKDLNLTGTGLTKCKTLTDSLTVESIVGLGTKVILRKEI